MASVVIILSTLRLSILKLLISLLIPVASFESVYPKRSTALLPVSIRPAALILGPILNTTSSIVRALVTSDSLIISFNPVRGESLSC